MVKICCACQRTELGGIWVEGVVLPVDERLTHGYCPECFAEAMENLQVFIAAQQSGAGAGCHCSTGDLATCGLS
ncbi:hypothetical protein [Desulfolithobacter sp.]